MKKYIILALILFLIGKCYISHQAPVTQDLNTHRGNTNKIYRCCENKCYLLEGLIEQTLVREVSRKEIYDNYDEATLIFNSRYCPNYKLN